MNKLILNTKTRQQLEAFVKQPTQAIAIVGAAGAGKGALAMQMAADILGLIPEKLASYSYFSHYTPEKNVITIEMARRITAQMTLKTTGKHAIRRVVVAEDAHTMTLEAQNALLKVLEEPPADTVLILTIASTHAVLPTIRSRMHLLNVYPIAETDLTGYFASKGYNATDVRRCFLMSGGLPGLMHAMLESEHPLVQSIEQAKTILQADTFTRLTMVDDIAAEKQLDNLFFAMKQTAHAALAANAAQEGREKALEKWALVLSSTHEAQDMLNKNANAKLTLTNLFLGL
jgi:DNA polymerase-3 subunit delta'